MKVVVFSAKPYDRRFLAAAGGAHELHYLDARLTLDTVPLARDAEAVCVFVNDQVDRPVLAALKQHGIKLVALRSAGFNHVDLVAAQELGVAIARVPSYSPEAIAEHTLALILSLNRNIHRAYARVREGNFALEGLLGFGLKGKTVGIIGTGRIGMAVARIMKGFGCHILAFDHVTDWELADLDGAYVPLEQLFAVSDIITIHCPLTPRTKHLITERTIRRMKPGVMLINTSRGAIIDTRAVVAGLKSGKIGYLGLDVYEEEGDLFFEDLSDKLLQDDIFARLLTFPNVLITGHQAFFTAEAMTSIATTTMSNITSFESSGRADHQISTEMLA
jgi:D-lactate dehydrogenase